MTSWYLAAFSMAAPAVSSKFGKRAVILASSITLAIGSWHAGPNATAEEVGTEEETVRLGIALDTAYNDSPQSLAELDLVLRILPKTLDTILPGESLEQYAVRRYGFGPNKQPEARKAFARILEELRVSNNTETGMVGPKEIRVPILPPRALERPNPKNPYNALPKTQSWGFELLSANQEVIASPETAIDDQQRRGSDSIFISIEVPRSYAETQRAQIGSATGLIILSEPLLIELGPTSGSASSRPFLLDSEREYLKEAAGRIRRQTVLYVLDAGWPDLEARDQSLPFLLTAVDDWRQNLGLPVLTPAAIPAFREGQPHSLLVKKALTELRALDPEPGVRVIFVPLTVDPSSEILFHRLLEAAFVERRLGVLGQPRFSTEVLLAQASSEASEVISHIRSASNSSQQGISTNRAIIEALYQLAEFTADRDDSFWVLSESWGVPRKLIKAELPHTRRGITVAASGNLSEVYPELDREFAGRSLSNSAFVGVINMSREGTLLCGSATVKESSQDAAAFLAISGEVEGRCGTSYSAPRVAWLLAMSEATRSNLVLAEYELLLDMGKHVRALRRGNQGIVRYNLEITRCCNR